MKLRYSFNIAGELYSMSVERLYNYSISMSFLVLEQILVI